MKSLVDEGIVIENDKNIDTKTDDHGMTSSSDSHDEILKKAKALLKNGETGKVCKQL